MPKSYKEKRRHVRIFFPASDQVTGMISEDRSQKNWLVKILNLSEGGLQLSQHRQEYGGLKAGDGGTISRLQGYKELVLFAPTRFQIRWVMDNTYFENIVFGIQFLDMDPRTRQMLHDFVANWLDRFGSGGEE